MSHYFIIALIFFAAGLVQGLSGFGAALLAMPLLVLILDVKEAVPLSILCGLVITLFLSLELKAHVDWRKILPLVCGCGPGIFLGVTILKRADSSLIKLSMGVLIILYPLYCLLAKRRVRSVSSGWAYVAGFATGVIGGAFSTGGPPTIIYTTLTNWTKDEIKATLSVFFLATGLMAAGAHFASGLTTPGVLLLFAASALPVLAGVWSGAQFYKRLARETYLKIIYILLMALGVMLIVSALG